MDKSTSIYSVKHILNIITQAKAGHIKSKVLDRLTELNSNHTFRGSISLSLSDSSSSLEVLIGRCMARGVEIIASLVVFPSLLRCTYRSPMLHADSRNS